MKRIFGMLLICTTLIVGGCSAKESTRQSQTTVTGTAISEVLDQEAVGTEKKLKTGNYYEETDITLNGLQYEYIKYTLEEDKTVRIISLKTKDDELIIPANLYGYEVSVIGGEWEELSNIPNYFDMTTGKYAWQNKMGQKLKKIVVSEGIKTIYSETFRSVSAETIILPKSLEVIESVAFADTKTEKVIIKSNKVRLEMGAFGDSKLKEIKLPKDYNGIIESVCFAGSNIESFTWPDWGNSKNKIEHNCFKECKNLKKVIFPENQEHIYIETGLFNSCPNLKELEFPASTKKVAYIKGNYAENYKKSVEVLIFRGKDTVLTSYWKFEDGSYYLTVGKIVAPKDSKAIEFAKKAKKVGYLPERYTKWHRYYLYMPTPGIPEETRGVTFVPMSYEETN